MTIDQTLSTTDQTPTRNPASLAPVGGQGDRQPLRQLDGAADADSGIAQGIVIRGAQEHNLKSIDLDLPRHKLTVLTGVSGSGKSSLAFDTVFKEGQRRYLESLSAYARQFLGQMEKPRVEHIAGLSPTVAVDQKTTNRNPRSTVGTITEVYDYLRVLYARVGRPHCPKCGNEIERQTPEQIVGRILSLEEGTRFSLMAPIVRGRKGEYRQDLASLKAAGYARARIDGVILSLDEEIELSRYKRHTIEVIIDRLAVSHADEDRGRLVDSVETCLDLGKGLLVVLFDKAGEKDNEKTNDKNDRNNDDRASDDTKAPEPPADEWLLSKFGGCARCGVHLPELEPRLFSFNSTFGGCSTCAGLGKMLDVDINLLIPDKTKSIRGKALACTNDSGYILYSRLDQDGWEQLAERFGFSLDTPWNELSPEHQKLILHGSGRQRFEHRWRWSSSDGKNKAEGTTSQRFPGIIPILRQSYEHNPAEHIERYMSSQTCPTCDGARLKPEALAVTFRDRPITDLSRMSVADLLSYLEESGDNLSDRDTAIAGQLLREIKARLGFLRDVGLTYLTLDRTADTLAGGEAQRLRLAAQLGAGLEGVLYVLDEPSIGLHQRDNQRLLGTLKALRDKGNTVLVVEHDEETIRAADFVVDFGPGAGKLGGEVVVAGTPAEVAANPESLTGQYLRHDLEIEIPETRRPGSGKFLRIVGAAEHNLRTIDVEIPLGEFVVVAGVSGSGKSTLVDDVLKKALTRSLHNSREIPGAYEKIEGIEHIDKVIEIDQTAIGRTPRSNPATYTGVFDHIRSLFSDLPESKVRGYKPGRFSFNVKGGRCEACGGGGTKVVEMQFLADVEAPCEACGGKRFNHETLRVIYKGKTISEVLGMTADEALEFFAVIPQIARYLQTLVDVGLGYLQLGQSSTTLSGGEAQRIKLAEQLSRPATGKTLYILDEPTTGLHFADVRRLLVVLNRLVDAGNSVLVVEHNPDVIKVADFIIDMGPEGGSGGGLIVAKGAPEEVARVTESHTGRLLAEIFESHEAHQARLAASPDSNGAYHSHHSHRAEEEKIDYEPKRSPAIRVRGARKHNLKGISLDIPKNKLTVITGVSGSGKSSLAMDTIFAEGQRRFVECLSSYARQFLGRLDDAAVDRIDGLAPAIAIDQKYGIRSPRSTVSTATELFDYLRLLFARLGRPFCPSCGKELVGLTSSEIVRAVASAGAGKRSYLLAPVARELEGDCADLLKSLRHEGYHRLFIDGKETLLDEQIGKAQPKLPLLDPTSRHDIEVVVDRLSLPDSSEISSDDLGALADSVELALARGEGSVVLAILGAEEEEPTRVTFSRRPACSECGVVLEEDLTPRLFSPNYHAGACSTCKGLGTIKSLSPDLVVPDRSLSYYEGAIALLPSPESREHRFTHTLRAVAARYDFDLHTPWKDLSPQAWSLILYGTSGERVTVRKERLAERYQYSWTREQAWPGIIPQFMGWYRKTKNVKWGEWVETFMDEVVCDECEGEKLKPLYRAVRLGERTIGEIGRMSVDEAMTYFESLELNAREAAIAKQAIKEVRDRLGFLSDVGLGYLTLDRPTSTLSGGEAQRIRLATQVGAKLVDALYVLDEPSVGLHQRDVSRLLRTLDALRGLGNTVIVVEHDEEIIRAADHIVDVGPGPGKLGGRIVAEGTVGEIIANPESLTGHYLREPFKPRTEHSNGKNGSSGENLVVLGAAEHNLKGIDVRFPLGKLIAVTGVSGSGKSTLVTDILEAALARRISARQVTPGAHRAIEGAERIERLVAVNQHPIGRSPKSNPATYTGVFDSIRELYAKLPEAKSRGYTKSRFSFNDAKGWCSKCQGEGVNHISMHFLADVEVICEACEGKRYNAETLTVKFRGKSIADVLEMSVDQAVEFFSQVSEIRSVLEVLAEVGLGYMALGQSSVTLSGGEAQRVKLAAELSRRSSSPTLYILDEPTVGLHFADVERLMAVLRKLVDIGQTVIVVEHNLDIIAQADHVIDLGPEGGEAGGQIVTVGTPAEVAACPDSFTGQFLAGKLGLERV